jgi:hypothetical protein
LANRTIFLSFRIKREPELQEGLLAIKREPCRRKGGGVTKKCNAFQNRKILKGLANEKN